MTNKIPVSSMSNHYDHLVQYSSRRRLNSPLSPSFIHFYTPCIYISLYVSAINLSNLRLAVCLLYQRLSHINLQFIPTNQPSDFCNLSSNCFNYASDCNKWPIDTPCTLQYSSPHSPWFPDETPLSIYVPKLISVTPLISLTWNKFYMSV